MAAGTGLEVQRTELVQADHLARVPGGGVALAIGDLIQLKHPVLLGLELRIGRLLPGLYPLKGDAVRVEQLAQALVADVLYHPL